MIKAVLLDCDGVTADTLAYHIQAWRKVFEKYHVQIDPQIVRMNEGSPAWKIGEAVATQAGLELSENECKENALEKNNIFRAINKATIYDGVDKIIEECKKRRIKTGLVTGTAYKNLQAIIPKWLMHAFDVIVKEGDSERGKPFPDPYLTAAKKLGISGSECLVLENAPMGIKSAKSAGAYCIALSTTVPAEHLQEADEILPDHHAFIARFNKYLKGTK